MARDRKSALSLNLTRQPFNERLRAEFVAGAEEESRRRFGRSLTREEMERVLRRYPGDV